MVQSVTFEVVGDQRLACESCERRVERFLRTMQGVRQVRAEARQQRVEVLLDTGVLDVPRVAERLREAGYETRVASPPDQSATDACRPA